MGAGPDERAPLSDFPDREEDTSSGRPLTSMPPLPNDRDEALGVLYASVARQGRHLEMMKRDGATVRTEVIGLRKDFAEFREDLKKDRSSLVHKAARRSSNRMAAI